ncbi:hypothetical protein C1646_754153 [Rhizophagus diaphanus]|nr:hypothetical protein C1646_754153 [Rhizophagus diaphanus] [Rhizophagus sp. MUCL 43196]
MPEIIVPAFLHKKVKRKRWNHIIKSEDVYGKSSSLTILWFKGAIKGELFGIGTKDVRWHLETKNFDKDVQPTIEVSNSKIIFCSCNAMSKKIFCCKNAITGLLLFGFCGAVFSLTEILIIIIKVSYSIMAVKQDDFDDVPMPFPPSTTNSEE